jgi:hypothetical protein
MPPLLKKLLFSLAFLPLALRLSDHLWTMAETHVHGWYLATPSLRVVGMSERMSAAEQVP